MEDGGVERHFAYSTPVQPCWASQTIYYIPMNHQKFQCRTCHIYTRHPYPNVCSLWENFVLFLEWTEYTWSENGACTYSNQCIFDCVLFVLSRNKPQKFSHERCTVIPYNEACHIHISSLYLYSTSIHSNDKKIIRIITLNYPDSKEGKNYTVFSVVLIHQHKGKGIYWSRGYYQEA